MTSDGLTPQGKDAYRRRVCAAALDRLEQDPALRDRVRRSLERALRTPGAYPTLRLWCRLIEQPVPKIRAEVLGSGLEAEELRHQAPFGGFFTTAELLRFRRANDGSG